MTEFDGFDEFADDLEEFARRMREFERRVPEAVDNALEATAQRVKTDASDNAPKDTNRLAKSYRANRVSKTKWEVATGVKYAKPVEYGSAPHIITPDDAEALHFFVDGEEVFAQRVEHPGAPAQPHLRPAVRENSNYLIRQLERELDKLAREVFAR
jgi:HK97 gp10 family phage protein